MKHLTSNTFADLYSLVIYETYSNPDYMSAPRGLKIHECLNTCLTLTDPTNNLFKCNDKALTLPTGYLKKEMILYLSGTNSAELFSKASGFWDKIKNPDGMTINSAYGNLIFNSSLSDGRSQFEWAYDSLYNDKDSRQAFMRYNNTHHQFDGVKDLPCTFIQIFHIRDNKLHSTVEMRSNDIVKGLAYDLPGFTLFQYLMYLKLKANKYPELELGEYNHIANSMHAYECDFELCSKRLDAGLIANSYPLPKSHHCIKSDDIDMLLDMKVKNGMKGIELDSSKLKNPENINFYNWLMS